MWNAEKVKSAKGLPAQNGVFKTMSSFFCIQWAVPTTTPEPIVHMQDFYVQRFKLTKLLKGGGGRELLGSLENTFQKGV